VIAIAAAVIGMLVAAAAYLQDREYKAANELLNTTTGAVSKSVDNAIRASTGPVSALATVQRPEQQMRHVGTITNENGTFEVLQDAKGKYHYVKRGSRL
jgi:hypothetical protein